MFTILHPDVHFVCFMCMFMCSHFHPEYQTFASVGCMVMSVLLFLFELDCKYLSIYTVDSVCQTPFRVFLAGGVGLTFVAGLC